MRLTILLKIPVGRKKNLIIINSIAKINQMGAGQEERRMA